MGPNVVGANVRCSQATDVRRMFCGGFSGTHAGSIFWRNMMSVLTMPTPTKEAAVPTASSLDPLTASELSRCGIENDWPDVCT
jgi:hypothetical protein